MKRWRELLAVCFLGVIVWTVLVCFGIRSIRAEERDANDKETARELPLPSSQELVGNLALSCHRAEQTPPPREELLLRHINPIVNDLGLYVTHSRLEELEEICSPVAQNWHFPDDGVHAYLRWIDFACFRAESEDPANIPLNLSHLSPTLQEMHLPDEKVFLTYLKQVCVPVVNNKVKNKTFPPPFVRRLVKHIDLACFEFETQPVDPFFLHMSHLSEVLRETGLDEQWIQIVEPKQLCLPVLKNDLDPPDEIVELIRWIDLKKYTVDPLAPLPFVNITLNHLNPLFQDAEPIETVVLEATALTVPVAAKNGVEPPR